MKEGWKEVPEWVFINSVGNPHDINHWRRRVFKKVLEKAKLRKIRIHDLRHTYASLLIQAGESLVYVRDQLGHHSIKVTVEYTDTLLQGEIKTPLTGLMILNFTQQSVTLPQPKKKQGLPKMDNPLI